MTLADETDGGLFAASVVYEHDRDRTRAAVAASGRRAFETFVGEAATGPQPADTRLLKRIHAAWFEGAFPEVAGTFRREVVLSRRPRVSPPHAIPNDVAAAFVGFEDDWIASGGDVRVRKLTSNAELRRLVYLANEISVRLHHIHPFLDGNTRACLTLRAYLPMRAGLPPVTGRSDEASAREAWDATAPNDHAAMDHVLYDQLAHEAERARSAWRSS